MVILKITAPDYKQSITMTITEDSTIRQLIFDIGKNFEEKGVHIEDLINWGLFFEPLLQVNKRVNNKTENNNNDNKNNNNNNNNNNNGKSGGGKIKSLRLSSSKGEVEREKKKGKMRSSSKTPLGEGENNFSSSPSPPLSSSKGFRLLSLRSNKSPVSSDPSSFSSFLSSDPSSDPSLPPSEGHWLDKKSLLYSLSLPDFSHLLFKRRQDITSVMEEKRKTAGSPQLKGKFDIGSNENSKVQYLLKGRLTRNEVVNEVLSTEKSYVSQLETLVKVFVNPAMEKGIFLNHYILDMFNQVKTIHSLHCEVLYQLEKKVETWSPSSSLGDVFLPIIPYLKMYGDYCLNYESNILDLLQLREDDKHVAKFIKGRKECEMDERFTLVFDSYLIVPVQRIPRYRLLFEQVVKYTPSDHGDYAVMSNTLDKINEVANYINTYQGQDRKMFETNGKIANFPGQLLEPSRKFIREGMLKKISSRASQERRVFLFSDLLVYCTPKKIPYSFKGQIPITPAVWINHDTDDLKKKAVQVVGEEKTYTFIAHSLEEKEKWITSLNKVIDDLISLRGQVPKNEIRVHQRGGIWKVIGPKI